MHTSPSRVWNLLLKLLEDLTGEAVIGSQGPKSGQASSQTVPARSDLPAASAGLWLRDRRGLWGGVWVCTGGFGLGCTRWSKKGR